MPDLTWIAEGTDLGFVREQRPESVAELLARGEAWAELFSRWYAREKKANPDDVRQWLGLVKSVIRDGKPLDEAAEALGITADRLAGWNLQISLDFSADCGEIRTFLEEQEAAVRKALADELQQAVNQGTSTRTSVTEDEVAERLLRKAGAAIAKSRSRKWEAEAGEDASQEMSRVTPVRMEAVLQAYTRTVKPKFMELYQTYRMPATKDLPDIQQLEAAHSQLLSAEAFLREACHNARTLLTGGKGRERARPSIDAKDLASVEELLFSAWVEYTQACTDLAKAIYQASEGLIKWAIAEAEKKIQTNFSSVHPEVAKVLTGTRIAVTVLSAVLQCMSIGTGPVGLAAAASVTACVDGLELLIVRAVSYTDARKSGKAAELAGMDFKSTSEANETTKGFDKANDVLTAGGGLPAPLLKAVASGTGSVAATELAPPAAQIARMGKLAKDAYKAFNPAERKEAPERDAYVAALKKAEATLGASISEADVDTFRFERRTGIATVTIDGVRGTLQNGRFSPEEVDAGFADALQRWAKRTGTSEGLLELAFNSFDFFGSPIGTFLLRGSDGQPVNWSDAASAIFSYIEEPLKIDGAAHKGYQCSAYASGLGLSKDWGDCWTLRFFLSHDGHVKYLGSQFDWMRVGAADDTVSITATDGEHVEFLKALIPVRAHIGLLPRVMRSSETEYSLEGGCLVGEDGLLLTEDEAVGLLDSLPLVLDIRETVESGSYVEVPWDDLPPGAADVIGDWREPLQLFKNVCEAPEAVDGWVIFHWLMENSDSYRLWYERVILLLQRTRPDKWESVLYYEELWTLITAHPKEKDRNEFWDLMAQRGKLPDDHLAVQQIRDRTGTGDVLGDGPSSDARPT
ncbi:hypothetical protein ACFQ78_32010 [Streptomyces sp. NPDC056519]|uniref:hypothetical protein n=1 Tax=Streptomyces sp. NPDC056519 TaxID=3345849 RepID=UPI00369CD020